MAHALLVMQGTFPPGSRIPAIIHGPAGTGVHGAILAGLTATAGFDGAVHMTKDGIFINGMVSFMVAVGILPVRIRFVGKTIMGIGATPKLHLSIVPMVSIG